MMRGIASSPIVLAGFAASLAIAVACSDDEDPGGGGKGGSSGSSSGGSGKGGSSGSSNGGSSNGGTNTGGSGKGGSGKGGTGNGGTGNGGSTNGGSAGTMGGTAGTSGSSGNGGTGDPGGMGGTDGGMGGEGGEGGEMVEPDALDNPGFETFGLGGKLDPIPGWQEAGDLEATYLEWDGGRSGHRLSHWREWVMTTAERYTATTYQRVAPIPNGTYTFSMWVTRKLTMDIQYLFARGHNASDMSEEMTVNTADNASDAGYVQVTLSGIQVTSGEVTVGVHTDTWGGDWSSFDDATLTKDP